MRIISIAVSIIALSLVTAALIMTGCQYEDAASADIDYGCSKGYELVFDIDVTFDSESRNFRFWLIEDKDDFLSGKILDESENKTHTVLGQKRDKDSYILTFTPGLSYMKYPCHVPISVSFDLMDLSGKMSVYCDLAEFETFPAYADIKCDNTGIKL